MIKIDLTEVLKPYCEWDIAIREKHLRYAERLINQHSLVVYKGVEYRLIDDLQVDLDSECLENS